LEDNKNIAGMDCVPFRIRKLTPKECWRLMGFTDEDVDKAVAVGMSNAQLYKQAGNSIVVQVLEAIFKQML
jgi:DNA (cytosine-5)-methyltransferase 1